MSKSVFDKLVPEPAGDLATGFAALGGGPEVVKVVSGQKYNFVTCGLLHFGRGQRRAWSGCREDRDHFAVRQLAAYVRRASDELAQFATPVRWADRTLDRENRGITGIMSEVVYSVSHPFLSAQVVYLEPQEEQEKTDGALELPRIPPFLVPQLLEERLTASVEDVVGSHPRIGAR